MDALITVLLALATILYAGLLDRFGDRWIDWTEVEVIIGTAIVLGFHGWRLAQHGDWTAWQGFQALVLDFAAGGAPIVIWYRWRNWRNYKTTLDGAIEKQRRQRESDEDEGEG